ncbi:Uncharacterised protein [uncultured archaeon]|nr:Uncharacterised protein [uncultured archaeon]
MIDLFAPLPALPGFEFRVAAVLLFTGAAAYYDIFNRKWVPNWLVYGFIIVSLLLNVVFFNYDVMLRALVFGIAVFLLTYPLYRMGQIGGADTYVMAGIAIAIPFLPSSLLGIEQSSPYPFVLSVLVPTGVFFILHMLARFVPYISRQLANGKARFAKNDLLGAGVILVAFAAFMLILLQLPVVLPPWYFAIISFLVVALVFFSLFKSQVKDSMVEQMGVAKLQEEDVLALEKMDKGLVAKLALSPLLTAKSIALLKKSKIRSVPVYTGMPFFLPYLFLGVVASLLFGDILLYLIRM